MKKLILFLSSIFVFFSFFLSILFLNNHPFTVRSTKGNLFLTGSSSMQQLCEDLGDEFVKMFPHITFSKSGSGSTEAVFAIKSGMAQIGDLSRPLQHNENPHNFSSHIIALDGIAVCTNSKNKISNISLTDLKKIFSGEIKNWKQLGGDNKKIVLIGRDFSSGTRCSFEKALNLKNIDYDIELENNGKVKFKIQQDDRSLGYISFSSVDESISPLKIDGVAPSLDNISNSTYHFSHPLLQITKKQVHDYLTQAWFSFLYSKKGAKIIKRNRFLPVPKN